MERKILLTKAGHELANKIRFKRTSKILTIILTKIIYSDTFPDTLCGVAVIWYCNGHK